MLTSAIAEVVCVGAYLSYQAASSQVLSARVSLTAVFGMGTGVPSPSSAPTECIGADISVDADVVTRSGFEPLLPA